MSMITFASNPNPTTTEEDIEYLYLQIQVGQLIKENPALQQYIEHQHRVLLRTVVNSSLISDSHNYQIVQAQAVAQIRVYEQLGTLADKLEENGVAYRMKKANLNQSQDQ